MAQVLEVPGDVRHGFSYNHSFNHDFGRITGIAATKKGNILLCDYDNKNLILVDSSGNLLKKINVDSEPYDLTITSQNIGFITLPNTRMMILFKATYDDLNTNVLCVSAIPNTGEDAISNLACFLGVKRRGLFYVIPFFHACYEEINLTEVTAQHGNLGSTFSNTRVVKFHALDETSYFSCRGGQNYITYSHQQGTQRNITIATMDMDICHDDYKHIYVSGQGSNNIHRLKKDGCVVYDSYRRPTNAQDWKVIDTPLNCQHKIKEPVAVCFNQNYSKFYVVNEWGKSVLVFDVI